MEGKRARLPEFIERGRKSAIPNPVQRVNRPSSYQKEGVGRTRAESAGQGGGEGSFFHVKQGWPRKRGKFEPQKTCQSGKGSRIPALED